MQLSIIIPFYNSGKYLPTCIDSLLNQGIDTKDYEILIINDGSTDNSLEVAQQYANIHSNISVHTKTNGGVGSARNRGMALAKGTYLYFIDPDDYLAALALKVLLEKANENSLEILTFSFRKTKDSNLYREPLKINNIELSSISDGVDYIANYRYKNEVWWYLVKKSFIDETKIKFIEGRWMEDAILTTQLFIKAKRMAHWPIDVHRHLTVAGSAMTNKNPSHYLKVIDDNRNAALVFEGMIEDLVRKDINTTCIKRLRTRQQSFVFFMMVRILRSTMTLDQVKPIINELSVTNAYPMNNFLGEDYKGWSYNVLIKVFNRKKLFYFLFKIVNPLLR